MTCDIYFHKINQITNVSRETFVILERYVDLLLKWNSKINLVSKSQANHSDIWERHVIDSAQLIQHIPSTNSVITDLGSGAGFPAIILSIIGPWQVHIVESDQRKAAFLTAASESVAEKTFVHNQRIEDLDYWPTDVITARALASVNNLLLYSHNFNKKNKICLFLKGKNVVEEIEEAAKFWELEYEVHPSLTDPSGNVLKILSATK